MINIIDKKKCCGCEACVQRCPRHCISLHEDEEGFFYPQVDSAECVNCVLCETVCPVINQGDVRKPIVAFAGKNRDESIRLSSSSGGVFSALADKVIDDGGVVFGAKFNDKWEVIHDYTETIDGLAQFRGSKYVQSQIGDNYKKAKQFLASGRKVLFSGTPCQIAGLKHFLKKEYENLLTVDFICHGVPSPGVWREYLKEEVALTCNLKNIVLPRSIHGRDALNVTIEGISFRDKTLGWKKFSFALDLSTTNGSGEKIQFRSRKHLYENPFLIGFLADLYLRPSCYDCPAKCGKSGSDITLGDFWGIDGVMPELDDDCGTSAVLANTPAGIEALQQVNVNLWDTEYGKILRCNPALEHSPQMPWNRAKFFVSRQRSFQGKIIKFTRSPLNVRIKKRIGKVAYALLGASAAQKLKQLIVK